MDWSKGYSAEYYATIVDPVTWKDIQRIELVGGNIKRTSTGLRDAATLDMKTWTAPIEAYIRIYLDTAQSESYAHEALFTGLATSPGRKAYATSEDRSVDCYSVLKAADDVQLTRGWYALGGQNAGRILISLLSVVPAPVEISDNAPTLASTIIAEDGETRLSMIEKVLDAIGWRMIIKGNGTICCGPFSDVPVATFDAVEYDIIEAPLTIKEDWYSCPNVLMAISGDMIGIARDDDQNSPLSTVRRGREVWKVEKSAALAANESIAEYANRALQEAQRIQQSVSYDRRYVPTVTIGDTVRLHYPAQDIDNNYVVSSQSITLGAGGCKTSEEVLANISYKAETERTVSIYYLIDDANNEIVTDDGDYIEVIA